MYIVTFTQDLALAGGTALTPGQPSGTTCSEFPAIPLFCSNLLDQSVLSAPGLSLPEVYTGNTGRRQSRVEETRQKTMTSRENSLLLVIVPFRF